MTENIGSGTAQGVIDYLNSLVDKGRARPGVVAPLKVALTKILEKTEGENWPQVDVTKLDVDDATLRFKNLTLGTYTDASYRAYELRTKRAIEWYKQFLANPGWFPKESNRAASTEAKRQPAKASEANVIESHEAVKGGREPSGAAALSQDFSIDVLPQLPKTEPVSYPFPLQGGEMARIYMPKSVTKADIARLSAFLDALVIEQVGHEENL